MNIICTPMVSFLSNGLNPQPLYCLTSSSLVRFFYSFICTGCLVYHSRKGCVTEVICPFLKLLLCIPPDEVFAVMRSPVSLEGPAEQHLPHVHPSWQGRTLIHALSLSGKHKPPMGSRTNLQTSI